MASFCKTFSTLEPGIIWIASQAAPVFATGDTGERFKRKWFVYINLLANTHNYKHLDHSYAVSKF